MDKELTDEQVQIIYANEAVQGDPFDSYFALCLIAEDIAEEIGKISKGGVVEPGSYPKLREWLMAAFAAGSVYKRKN